MDDVHEDPHDVVLPEPYTLVYETEVAEGEEDVFGEQQSRRVWVWPSLHHDDEELVFTLLHEIGHLYENECLGNEGKMAWMHARGTGNRLSDWRTGVDWTTRPNEDFADAWAVCQGGDPVHWAAVGEPPTDEECSLAVPSNSTHD